MNNTISVKSDASKEEVFAIVKEFLEGNRLSIASVDITRPWGGFFCIDDKSTKDFISCFFPDITAGSLKTGQKLSPKILLVEKGKRLSWQYHHRRAEIWKVIGGTVQVVISDTDEQQEPVIKKLNEIIHLNKGQRHRLIGTNGWGIIAEIWQHTENLSSDEDDIVRVEDDFGR